MERNAITELEQLTLTGASKNFLREIAKWAFFLSIMGFVLIVFMLLAGVFAGSINNSIYANQNMPFDMTNILRGTYFFMAIIYVFPVLYLYKFSRKIKLALSTKNDDTLAEGFEMLKSHYKFLGVFTIITTSLYILFFVVAILGFL